MIQGHFIVGEGENEACIYTAVPPFLWVFMASYFNDSDEMMSKCF